MKNNFKIITLAIAAIFICVGGFLWYANFHQGEHSALTITQKGNNDIIEVSSPKPNAKITSPVVVTGTARGSWYFEASFPISVVDWDGKIIGQGIAQAQSDWATSSFVAFKAVITFDTTEISNGTPRTGALILKKDNPSGLPSNDDSIEIPIIFK